MADDNADLEMEGGDGAAPAGKKGGGLGKIGGLFSGMLKWILIGVAGVILIVVVVFVTIGLVKKNSVPAATVPVSEQYAGKREVLEWYSALPTINVTNTTDKPPTSITVEIVLGHKTGDNAVKTELTGRLVEMQDFLRRYFTQKSYAELQPQNEDMLKIEIRNAINDQILSTSKINDVAFKQLRVVQQQ